VLKNMVRGRLGETETGWRWSAERKVTDALQMRITLTGGSREITTCEINYFGQDKITCRTGRVASYIIFTAARGNYI
jgi:hypothetical protein